MRWVVLPRQLLQAREAYRVVEMKQSPHRGPVNSGTPSALQTDPSDPLPAKLRPLHASRKRSMWTVYSAIGLHFPQWKRGQGRQHREGRNITVSAVFRFSIRFKEPADGCTNQLLYPKDFRPRTHIGSAESHGFHRGVDVSVEGLCRRSPNFLYPHQVLCASRTYFGRFLMHGISHVSTRSTIRTGCMIQFAERRFHDPWHL